MVTQHMLQGIRNVVKYGDDLFPRQLYSMIEPPEQLYVVGDPAVLREGLAIVGARNATPYGIGCARRFARLAAERGVAIVSGGARGCDAAAHNGALQVGGKTIIVCGFGCDMIYPAAHRTLFQRVVESGGAVISEYPWDTNPQPFMFRRRNRIIAGLSKATLVVEAGLPSGTFSTADAALESGREVWAVPGSITSTKSFGANRLIAQGATPIVDDESFHDAITSTYGVLRFPEEQAPDINVAEEFGEFFPLLEALQAEPMNLDSILELCEELYPKASGGHCRGIVMDGLSKAEEQGLVTRYGDGRIGPRIA